MTWTRMSVSATFLYKFSRLIQGIRLWCLTLPSTIRSRLQHVTRLIHTKNTSLCKQNFHSFKVLHWQLLKWLCKLHTINWTCYLSGFWLCIDYLGWGCTLSIWVVIVHWLYGLWLCIVYLGCDCVLSISIVIVYFLSGSWLYIFYLGCDCALSIWVVIVYYLSGLWLYFIYLGLWLCIV